MKRFLKTVLGIHFVVLLVVLATIGYLIFAKPVQTALEYRGEVCIPMPCREVWSQPWHK